VWTLLQTHHFSGNLVAPGIEPRPLDLQLQTLTTRPQRWSIMIIITIIRVKLLLSLSDEALGHEDARRSGCIDPYILNLGTHWR
jgi:hypothetical protein